MTIPSMTMKIVGDGRCSSFNIMMTIISMCMIVITSTTVAAAEICTSPTNTFTVKIDMFASELGMLLISFNVYLSLVLYTVMILQCFYIRVGLKIVFCCCFVRL